MDHPRQGEGDDQGPSCFAQGASHRRLPEQRQARPADQRPHRPALRRNAQRQESRFQQFRLILTALQYSTLFQVCYGLISFHFFLLIYNLHFHE